MKQPHTMTRDADRPVTTATDERRQDDKAATTKTPPADKPDGPKEHFEAVRFLIGQIRTEKLTGTITDALDKIDHRLDLLEEKPEAVAAEKQRLAEIEAANAEKAKADKTKQDAKAS